MLPSPPARGLCACTHTTHTHTHTHTHAQLLSRVQLFASPWTVARQAPLSMGILQARILDWVAMPSSRGSFQPGIEPRAPALQADSLQSEPPGKPKKTGVGSLSLLQASSRPRNGTGVSCIAGRFLPAEQPGKPFEMYKNIKSPRCEQELP